MAEVLRYEMIPHSIEFGRHSLEPMEIRMLKNAEFMELSRRLHQDITDVCADEASMIRFAISPFKENAKRAKLRAYIDEVISERISDQDLQRIWWSSAADIVFNDGKSLRAFLSRVRDSL